MTRNAEKDRERREKVPIGGIGESSNNSSSLFLLPVVRGGEGRREMSLSFGGRERKLKEKRERRRLRRQI